MKDEDPLITAFKELPGMLMHVIALTLLAVLLTVICAIPVFAIYGLTVLIDHLIH